MAFLAPLLPFLTPLATGAATALGGYGAKEGIKALGGELKEGGKIPKTGAYKLHKGEVVLTKAQQKAIKKAGGGKVLAKVAKKRPVKRRVQPKRNGGTHQNGVKRGKAKKLH